MELVELGSSGKETVPGQKLPTSRKLALIRNEPLQFGRPAVMLSISSASEEDKAAPVAYIIRDQFSASAAK